MMDDDEYGEALLQELKDLAQDLVHAKRERLQVKELLQDSQEARRSLHLQIAQRSSHNQDLVEQELLKQQIDAKRREKVRLLKELATSKRRHLELQRAAGLDPPVCNDATITDTDDVLSSSVDPQVDEGNHNTHGSSNNGNSNISEKQLQQLYPKSPSGRRKRSLRGLNQQERLLLRNSGNVNEINWERNSSIDLFSSSSAVTAATAAVPLSTYFEEDSTTSIITQQQQPPDNSNKGPSTPRSIRRRRVGNRNLNTPTTMPSRLGASLLQKCSISLTDNENKNINIKSAAKGSRRRCVTGKEGGVEGSNTGSQNQQHQPLLRGRQLQQQQKQPRDGKGEEGKEEEDKLTSYRRQPAQAQQRRALDDLDVTMMAPRHQSSFSSLKQQPSGERQRSRSVGSATSTSSRRRSKNDKQLDNESLHGRRRVVKNKPPAMKEDDPTRTKTTTTITTSTSTTTNPSSQDSWTSSIKDDDNNNGNTKSVNSRSNRALNGSRHPGIHMMMSLDDFPSDDDGEDEEEEAGRDCEYE